MIESFPPYLKLFMIYNGVEYVAMPVGMPYLGHTDFILYTFDSIKAESVMYIRKDVYELITTSLWKAIHDAGE